MPVTTAESLELTVADGCHTFGRLDHTVGRRVEDAGPTTVTIDGRHVGVGALASQRVVVTA